MKKWKWLLGFAVLSLSIDANAVLVERLGGLAYYDTLADLTWLADANYAQTSGFDDDGRMTWGSATAWVSNLNVAGIDGWRLPDTMQPDPSCSYQKGTASYGYGCTGSELGNHFQYVLGGYMYNTIEDRHNDNYNLFTNIQNASYWSSTELQGAPTLAAWFFNYGFGNQGNGTKTYSFAAWAVHDGDVGLLTPVPAPAAVWLFGSGLLGLIGVARRRRIVS